MPANSIVPANPIDATFYFDEYPIRILRNDEGDPWFIAQDVCAALEIGNVSRAVSRLDDDEKATITLSNNGSEPPKMLVISEAGLYSLVLSSRKESAVRFKRWITHEVLPELLRTGQYGVRPTNAIVPANPIDALEIVVKALRAQQSQLDNHEDRLEWLESYPSLEYDKGFRDGYITGQNNPDPDKDEQ